jgi:anti-sigma regulatory factor (Ser/Thr protein kinase)
MSAAERSFEGGALLHITVRDESQVGDARRRAAGLARSAGCDELLSGRLAIIVTELAKNLLRHARDGELLLLCRDTPPTRTVDVLAIDRGPGMANVAGCLRDGFSTAGTPGTGLGAVRRLSEEFDIHSQRDRGTVVLARLRLPSRGDGVPANPTGISWGVVAHPAPGETVCGDGWAVSSTASSMSFLVADGLGHGPEAAQASASVCRTFRDNPDAPPDVFLDRASRQATGTRGAAAAIAQAHLGSDRLVFAGVGNIAAAIIGPAGRQGMVSMNGIVGGQARSVRSFEHVWPVGTLLVMHSDGLASRWSLDDHPGLGRSDPAVIAAVLARDHARGRDDVAVLVARREPRR